jgi:II/X family phage/plasmid replication protein
VIDWLTLRVWAAIPVDAGVVISIDADGVQEWVSPKRLNVEGSYSSTVTLRRFGYDGTIEISGCPAKFLQGHNLFGSDDLPGLSRAFIEAVCQRLGYRLTPDEHHRITEGIVPLRRIDCTDSYDFGSLPRALNVLRVLADRSYFVHRGRGSMTKEGTVYWNKHSRHLGAKAYAKGQEIKAHKLPLDIPLRDELQEFAQGLVRFEFVHRAMWLKQRGLDLVANWTRLGVTPAKLHAELMADMSVTDATLVESEKLETLPLPLRLIYDAWQSGKDLRRMLPRSTFYKRRRELLEHGIDIATVMPSAPESNVIPIRITLVGKPVGVPAWAVGTPLYFDTAKAA